MQTKFQDEAVANTFVDERRPLIPYGTDQIEMMLRLIARFCRTPEAVVDLGCGDGILARMVLLAYPDSKAVLMDHSEPMIVRAREKMREFGDRSKAVVADLTAPLRDFFGDAEVDLVVSGYAIHHLPDERKRTLYAEIYDLLAPGGMFINVEHVSSPTPEVEAFFHEMFVRHMAEASGRPYEELLAEHHARPDQDDNILVSTEVQLQWLREIGFTQVDCFFKYLELAVFGGVKPGEQS